MSLGRVRLRFVQLLRSPRSTHSFVTHTLILVVTICATFRSARVGADQMRKLLLVHQSLLHFWIVSTRLRMLVTCVIVDERQNLVRREFAKHSVSVRSDDSVNSVANDRGHPRQPVAERERESKLGQCSQHTVTVCVRKCACAVKPLGSTSVFFLLIQCSPVDVSSKRDEFKSFGK
jgi:hypothetical protein